MKIHILYSTNPVIAHLCLSFLFTQKVLVVEEELGVDLKGKRYKPYSKHFLLWEKFENFSSFFNKLQIFSACNTLKICHKISLGAGSINTPDFLNGSANGRSNKVF